MAITHVQSTGSTDDSSTFDQAFGSNVTAGNLVVCAISLYTGSADAIVVGDFAKSAGTATITDAQLAITRQTTFSGGGAGERAQAAIWSAIVSGTGSLTLTHTRADGASGPIAVGEWSSDVGWDASRLEDSASDVSTTAGSGTASSGTADSADDALYIGALSLARSGHNSPITAGGEAASTIAQEGDGISHMCGSVSYGIKTGATSGAATWTYNTTGGQGWAACVAVFKEAGGGGAITLDADQGTITVTGQAATARFNVAAAQGSVTVAGQATTTRISMAGAQGTVAVAGQAATAAWLVALAQGTCTVVGQAATVNWQINAAQGTIAIIGYDADFDLPGAINMAADTGLITVTGQAASVAWTVLAAQGSLSVSGQAAAFMTAMYANLGTFQVVGYDADFDGVTLVVDEEEEDPPRRGRRYRRNPYWPRASVPFWKRQYEQF